MKTSKLKLKTMMRTILLMLRAVCKASSNFSKPVSNKYITEAMQKAVPLKTQTKETISIAQRDNRCCARDNKYCANVYHYLRAWGLSA